MISRALPVILICLSIGIFFLYISPTYKNGIIPLQEEIKKSDSALAAAADFNEKQAQIATERAAIPSDAVEKLQKYLPDGVDNVQMILDLNALAARSGVTLSRFGIKENSQVTSNGAVDTSGAGLLGAQKAKGTDSLDLSVTATGTYSSFRTFLYGIEHSLRPLDVTQIIINDSKTGVYSYDMTLRIYWLR